MYVKPWPHSNHLQSRKSMSESRVLSFLFKSCISDSCHETPTSTTPLHHPSSSISPISSLPDDLLLECFSRLPLSSLPSLSLVCRRFSLLLNHPSFHHLRISTNRLLRSLFSLSISHPNLLTATTLPLPFPSQLHPSPFPLSLSSSSFSHPSIASIGRLIFIIGRGATLRCDSLTGAVSFRAPTIFPRKNFAAAAIGSRIYVSGGATRTSAVEEYDPEGDEWRVVAEAPRRRYGCVGAGAGGVFYVAGGLRVGGRREEAHDCAGSMDAYHVKARGWLRVRAVVPGGGCVVGACGVGGYVYVLARHALEISFWRWEGKGRRGGDWKRLERPPVVAGRVGVGGAVHFSCASIGEGKMAAVVCGGRMRGLVEEAAAAAALVVYDIEADEWSHGMDLPPGLRRGACACVEC